MQIGIRHFNTLDEATNRFDKLPTFGEEIYERSEQRRFIVASYDEYVSRYIKSSRRATHEYVQRDKEIRMFFDAERNTDDGYDRQRFDDVVDSLINKMTDVAEKVYGVKVTPPTHYDCSRTTKHSRHVVFDLVFPDVHQMSRFIREEIVPKLTEEESAALDMSVYVARRSLRIPFSTAYDKKTKTIKPPVLPYEPVSKNTTKHVTEHAILKGLLHNTTENYVRLPKRYEDDHHYRRRRLIPSPDDATDDFDVGVFDERMKIWAKASGYDVCSRVAMTKENNTELEIILHGVTCANKREPHTSNRTYLHVRLPYAVVDDDFSRPLRASGTFACGKSTVCKGVWWTAGDFAAVIFPNVVSHELKRAYNAKRRNGDFDFSELNPDVVTFDSFLPDPYKDYSRVFNLVSDSGVIVSSSSSSSTTEEEE